MSKHSVLPTNHQGNVRAATCAILRSIYGLTPTTTLILGYVPILHRTPRPYSRTVFPEPLATRQPTVSWYIANLSYYARASAGVFYTALEYLERAKPRFRPVPGDPRTAFVGALILAHRSSRMISACIEAMFDALEHRLWIGALPEPNDNRMFSMREGTIFSEEMLGGQRRCSLPSLSVLYGARSVSTTVRSSSRSFRAFGDPQSIPNAAESTQPIAGPSNASSVPVTKPVQGLPSPPASPSSSSHHRLLASLTLLKKYPTFPGVLVICTPVCPCRLQKKDFSIFPNGKPRTSSERHHQVQVQAMLHLYHLHLFPYPAPTPSPTPTPGVVAQWCAPIPELAEDSTSEMEVEHEVKTTPPRTPCDSTSGSDPDAFNPSMWAAQASLFPPSTAVLPQMSLATPAPTVKVESPEKKMRYPSATLVPPSSCLDPAWNGRRHSIAVTGTRY
ncbi:hypothetical protein RHS01_04373 [Rhizoctonia solani]|uniref:Uncharacterized protein n=1 Tax=Rhizoctonia solani TaxID=456999 RepID=A0A8H7ID76_9AGAM|nr:hypothetical protein RHS01_04373 [Rhizoctonia solani]